MEVEGAQLKWSNTRVSSGEYLTGLAVSLCVSLAARPEIGEQQREREKNGKPSPSIREVTREKLLE